MKQNFSYKINFTLETKFFIQHKFYSFPEVLSIFSVHKQLISKNIFILLSQNFNSMLTSTNVYFGIPEHRPQFPQLPGIFNNFSSIRTSRTLLFLMYWVSNLYCKRERKHVWRLATKKQNSFDQRRANSPVFYTVFLGFENVIIGCKLAVSLIDRDEV